MIFDMLVHLHTFIHPDYMGMTAQQIKTFTEIECSMRVERYKYVLIWWTILCQTRGMFTLPFFLRKRNNTFACFSLCHRMVFQMVTGRFANDQFANMKSFRQRLMSVRQRLYVSSPTLICQFANVQNTF